MKRLLCCLFTGSFLAICSISFADNLPDLMDVFQQAAKNDPTYQQQIAIYNAAKEQLPISLAAILPSLDLNSAIARVIQTNALNGSSNLTQKNYGLNISQTIFNFSTFEQIVQARHSVRAAAYTLSAAGQDVMIRTAQAYYAVLEANDLVNYTKEQKTFSYEQYQATLKRYNHREATITDLNQVKGSYELIEVQLTQAQQQLYTSYQNLEQITATPYRDLAKLKAHFPLVTPQPNNLASWVDKAKKENLTLLAAEQTMFAQHAGINVQRGNYLPNLTATGSYSKGQEILSSDTTNALVTGHFHELQGGFNVQWNIYQGGLTNAQVRQTVANYEQAYAQRDQAYLNAMANARIAFNNVNLGITEIKNARLAMQSSTLALLKAEKGYRVGLLTLTDLLQIQNQLFETQKQYINVLYSYLVNFLLLEQAAGTLSIQSMMVENQWLV